MSCCFLLGCTGYYSHERPYVPDFRDVSLFRGAIVKVNGPLPRLLAPGTPTKVGKHGACRKAGGDHREVRCIDIEERADPMSVGLPPLHSYLLSRVKQSSPL